MWTALGLLSAAQAAIYLTNTQSRVHWPQLVVAMLLDWYSLAIFTPVFFWLARRYPADRAPRVRNLVVLAVSSFAIVVLKYESFVPLIQRLTPRLYMWMPLTRNLIIETLCVWAILAAIHAFLSYQRLREREIELANSRLETLTAQLQPHFLFNTMNSVVTLIRRDPAAAEDMVVTLGELLRRALDERQVVPLSAELEVLDLYLEIARRRAGQALTVKTDIAQDVESASVPRFLLQPLVENALEHGVLGRDGPGTIAIAAHQAGGRLIISVADDGPGLSSSAVSRRPGIGLRNTERRLHALYGADAVLELGRADLGGALVRITMPFR